MVASSRAGDQAGTSGLARSYPIQQTSRRSQVTSNGDGFWTTLAVYSSFGILAAAAIDTLMHARRPRDLVDGIVLAVNASLDRDLAHANARFNTEMIAFFGPAVAAAGLVLAVQIGRQISASNR